MRHFLLGLLAGVVLLALAVLGYIRLGFFDPRADIPVSTMEAAVAMPAMDASEDRHAPEAANPVQPVDANLMAGMEIYQKNCAVCHGDIAHHDGALAESLYPRAPQFEEDTPDMPENQNFYIIQHGVRLSGMPAWQQVLSSEQMWQVTTFLSHMDKLPDGVANQWKVEAGGAAPAAAPAAAPPAMKPMGKMGHQE